MKIKCSHGYFTFEENYSGEISDFMAMTGLMIVSNNEIFTFEELADAPDYALVGGEYLGAAVSETYEGKPHEIMRANGLVYDFSQSLVVPIATIVNMVELKNAGAYYVANGLILPGSVTDDGERITDYSAWYSKATGFRYSEVNLE